VLNKPQRKEHVYNGQNLFVAFQDGKPASREQHPPSHGADPRATCRAEDELLLFLEKHASQMEMQTWPLHHHSVFHVFFFCIGVLQIFHSF
jgi:hypothetical protein